MKKGVVTVPGLAGAGCLLLGLGGPEVFDLSGGAAAFMVVLGAVLVLMAISIHIMNHREPDQRAAAQPTRLSGAPFIRAEAAALASEIEGRLSYVNRELANGDAAGLKKWVSKIQMQRVPFTELRQADQDGLSEKQYECLRVTIRALDELDRAITIIARSRRAPPYVAGLYKHRATKARVMIGRLLSSFNADTPSDERLPVREGIAYLVLREWGRTLDDALSALPGGLAFEAILRQFQQAAHDRKFTVWGRKAESGLSPSDLETKIPPGHWETHQLEVFSLTAEAKTHARRPSQNGSDPFYTSLRISRTEFEKGIGP